MTEQFAALSVELDKLNDKATPGPWHPDPELYDNYIWGPGQQMVAMMRGEGEGLPVEANRDLLIVLRNNLPIVMTALEAAQTADRNWTRLRLTAWENRALKAEAQVEKLTKALKETITAEAKMHSMVGTPYFAQECLEYAARKAKEALSAIEEES